MEAIDTVIELALISDGKCEWFQNLPDYEKRNLNHQAEISFPKGIDKGRKEVVEWVKAQEESRCMDCVTPYTFSTYAWQAQLKEWGL